MKRITTWFLSTVTVVVLLFGYHTSTSSVLSTATPPAVTSGAMSSGARSGSSGSSSGTSGGTASTKKASSTRITGSVAQTMWGPVQVQLTVSGGLISDIAVLQYPSGNSRDQEINGYALPVLIQETLDKQGAQIDMVSGATVTSTGYLQSLQSALDQAAL